MKRFLWLTLLVSSTLLPAGCAHEPEADGLPEIVYMCPMLKDADVLEDHAGKCPRCGMELKPVRIVKAYSCLNNTAFIQDKPGTCVTDGSPLVPITASTFWVCPAEPGSRELSPGRCANGTTRVQKFEPRLHGDHNPRHGGQLFMADDGWHHVEGAYSLPGVFRVFFYDDWTRPLEAKSVTAAVTVKNGKNAEAIPLVAGALPSMMEAHVPDAALPLGLSLRVRFAPGQTEKTFDFTFSALSADPAGPLPITAAPIPAGPEPPAAVVVAEPPPPPVAPSPAAAPTASNPALSPMDIIPVGGYQLEPIPATARGVLAELKTRVQDLALKIEQRAPLGEYWLPALRTKDLALALVTDHLKEIPSRRRAAAENAVGRLTRAAYAIDNFGDLGDFDKILSAHAEFKTAVGDLREACASLE